MLPSSVATLCRKHAGHCNADRNDTLLCSHVRRLQESLPGTLVGSYYSYLKQILLFAFSHMEACPSTLSIAHDLVDQVCAAIDDAVHEREQRSNIKELGTLKNASGKRLRIDQDLKEAVVHSDIVHKRSRNAQAAAASAELFGNPDSSVVDVWSSQRLLKYVASGREALQHAQFVSVASDGKRIGKEETNYYSVYSRDAGVAVWAQPKVIIPCHC